MSHDVVVTITPTGFPWRTSDPFLFCVHHADAYPRGNAELGPEASLGGRELGYDFAGKDGWRMYHGERIPGFPAHPHRGFETVTVVREGVIDHADSLGATARFGAGDTQWLTAGAGIQHSEMFPLLSRERENPLELFQIWLNLPSANKLVTPYFSMLWRDRVPKLVADGVEVEIVAGSLAEQQAPSPPPDSWASQPDSELAIWVIKLAPGARWELPPSQLGVGRSLYFFRGGKLTVARHAVDVGSRVQLRAELPAALINGDQESELLLLQGRPIGEPVAQEGPFVMNTRAELAQAFMDYRRTQFGGWPWPSTSPVHAGEEGRFAKHPDGRVERPSR
ncbi:MAG TPA: pirin family protein [Polyangiales bacterium]|nr:pirin family protein [Polyangiales bacterium]